MNVLFLHKVFPGQFEHLIEHLSTRQEVRMHAICQQFVPEFHGESFPRCEVITYRSVPFKHSHPFTRRFQSDVANGEAVAQILAGLKEKGYRPDLVVAHAGWGEALYIKDVFPDVPLLIYCEFFYQARGADVDFDPSFNLTIHDRSRIRSLNAAQLLQLVSADAAVSPMNWQKGLYPPEFRHKIRTIHEGVDRNEFAPRRFENFELPDGTVLDRHDEIVTYVARSLEPYRGFDQFMRAVEQVQRRRPRAHVLIAGSDEVTYSPALKSGRSYREKLCAEVDIDPHRTHFLGWLPNEIYRRLLRVSSVHAYLTAPFVLSWSLIEAMSTACVIVASATQPVEEVIRHGSNGLLCDFFSPEQFADAICEVLEHPTRMRFLGEQARRDVADSYDKDRQVQLYLDLIGRLTGFNADMPRRSV